MKLAPDQVDKLLAAHIASAPAGEPVYLGCELTTGKTHVPSVQRRCRRCQRPVWVSARIAAVLPPHNAVTVCLDCLPT